MLAPVSRVGVVVMALCSSSACRSMPTPEVSPAVRVELTDSTVVPLENRQDFGP